METLKFSFFSFQELGDMNEFRMLCKEALHKIDKILLMEKYEEVINKELIDELDDYIVKIMFFEVDNKADLSWKTKLIDLIISNIELAEQFNRHYIVQAVKKDSHDFINNYKNVIVI